MKSQKPWASANIALSSKSGFSLIEVIIVVALTAAIVGFGVSFSLSSIARASASSERDFLVSLLTQARARSLANLYEKPHGVHIDTANNRYVTYRGVAESSGTDKKFFPMTTSATFAGRRDFSFAQLSARVSGAQAGTTTITFAGQEYTVNVSTVGRIDW